MIVTAGIEFAGGGTFAPLILHGLGTQREGQTNDDHRGKNISGTVHAFPHTAGGKQNTVFAALELVNGVFVAAVHLNQRILPDLILDFLIDRVKQPVGCKQNRGVTVGGFHQLRHFLRDGTDIVRIVRIRARRVFRDVQPGVILIVKGRIAVAFPDSVGRQVLGDAQLVFEERKAGVIPYGAGG